MGEKSEDRIQMLSCSWHLPVVSVAARGLEGGKQFLHSHHVFIRVTCESTHPLRHPPECQHQLCISQWWRLRRRGHHTGELQGQGLPAVSFQRPHPMVCKGEVGYVYHVLC